MSKQWKRQACLVFSLAVVACGEGDLELEQPSATLEERRQELAGTGVQVENTSANYGKYQEVMEFSGSGGCTGTVVGPHAVLSANHCPATGNVKWPSSGVSYAFSLSQTSPYLQKKFWPRWWKTLNDQQIASGGRTDDWPAQHDLRIAFVPQLTPEWLGGKLATRGWRPAAIDASAPTGRQIAVGVCSGGCSDREFVDITYAASKPDYITGLNRDGYFNYEDNGTYFTSVESGDSGGPALGSTITPWAADPSGEIEGPRHVLSTHQGIGSYSEAGHNAPLAYNINVSLTTNQRYTARLNQQWARAALSDADGDGLPYECDGDPLSASSSLNRCTTPLGTTATNVPRGLLQCKPGHVVTGVKGNAGWYIDSMAVRCTPTACLRRKVSCAEEYWTDHFAGDSSGGSAYSSTCALGEAAVYVRGQHTAGVELNELQLWCYDYASMVDSGVASGGTNLGVIGNDFGQLSDGAAVSWERCPGNGVIVGFDVQSNLEEDLLLYWLTGVRPVCSGPIKETPFHGSMGGDMKALRCPESHVGVGFVSAPYTLNPDYVGLVGLLCMDKASVGLTPSDSSLVVAHGSYYLGGSIYPAMEEGYGVFKARHGLGSTYVESKCPAGSTVTGASFATNLAGDGRFINRFHYYICTDSAGVSTTQYMYVGAPGGNYQTLRCASSQESIVGLNLDSGWLTDGLGLVCRAN